MREIIAWYHIWSLFVALITPQVEPALEAKSEYEFTFLL